MDDTKMDPGPVGRGLTAAREAADFTLAAAAELTKELGVPIHRVALGKMEAGERMPTVTELFVLAIGYDTSPAAILFSDSQVDAEVEVIPGIKMSGVRALQWFSGERVWAREDYEGARQMVDHYNYVNLSINAARELERARGLVKFAADEFRAREDLGILEAAVRTKMQAVDVARGLDLIVDDDG